MKAANRLCGFDIGWHQSAWEYGNRSWSIDEDEEDFDESGDIRCSLVVKQFITYYGGTSR